MVLRDERLIHRGTHESLSVHALGAAVRAAAHCDAPAWVELLRSGFSYPDLRPGRSVGVEHIAVLVGFVSERAEHAAAVAVAMAEGLARDGMDQTRSRNEVIAGLAQFLLGARRWVRGAGRYGGAAMVETGPPTINDPSLPEWPAGS